MSYIVALQRSKRLVRSITLAISLLLAFAPLLGCQGDSTARPVPTVQSTPERKAGTMSSPDYAVQVFLWGNPGSTERDLRLVRDAGFTWIKQMFPWAWMEGPGKGKYEWNEPDRIVKAAHDQNLKILARVDIPPKWAMPKNYDPTLHGPPANLQDFADMLSAMATRYKGKIEAYQIWNEPNLAREWGGKQPNAADYVTMLKMAYQVIKKADPDAIVISAGLSPTTASGAIATPDVEYLKQMYTAGAKPYFDVLGAHGAGYRSPPEADPAQVAKDPVATNRDPSPEAARRVYAFRHVEDIRAVMVANGDEKKQVAILEFGWTSDPRPDSPYRWHAVSEEQKAKYIAGAYAYAKEHWKPWIGVMSVIYIASPQWTQKDEQYWWSITDEKGNPRPAYEGLKKLKK